MSASRPERTRSRGRTSRRRRERLYLVAVAIVGFGALLLVVGTVVLTRLLATDPGTPTSDELPPAPTSLPEVPLDYVALGDSYAAGPGLLPARSDPVACERGRSNYPAYLAQWLSVRRYADVSCTGAMTPSVTAPQVRPDGTTVPPQLDAVTPGTDLVTLTLGGNDRGVFQRIVTDCPGDSDCFRALDDLGPDAPDVTVAGLADRTVDTIERIREVAPRALVVVVGYPAIFPPDDEGCEELGFSGRALTEARAYLDDVADALAGAAARTGVMFVEMRTAGAQHHVCSDDPWMAGQVALDGTTRPWHLYQQGMRSIASVVLQQLTGSPAPAGTSPAQPPADSLVTNPPAAEG